MDYLLIIYATFLSLGMLGLYSLRNMSIRDNFASIGPIIGFATLIQKITVGIGIPAFIIIAIIKSKWYSPFLVLFIGLIISAIIGKILIKLNLMQRSTQKTDFGMLVSTIITTISLFLLLTFYFI